jgi:hypothetical protein
MIDKNKFSHRAWLYCVPIYVDAENGFLAGRNRFFDELIPAFVRLHNLIVEPCAQILAALSGGVYEPHFPIYITGEIEKK